MSLTAQDEKKRVHDISSRAVSLAREVDRLAPGTFTIVLVKPDLEALSWTVQITDAGGTVREMVIPKSVVSR